MTDLGYASCGFVSVSCQPSLPFVLSYHTYMTRYEFDGVFTAVFLLFLAWIATVSCACVCVCVCVC
ncbi:hypothetical protein F4810DRAFT_675939, partial [Camillea tinctor]